MLKFWQFEEHEYSDSQPEMYWTEEEKNLGNYIIDKHCKGKFGCLLISERFGTQRGKFDQKSFDRDTENICSILKDNKIPYFYWSHKPLNETPFKKSDYLAETIIEGLYQNGIELKCSCPGNGVSENDILSSDELIEYAKTADYVFAIWGKKKGIYPGVDYNLVKKINQPQKTVYIDGSEWNCHAQTYPNQVAMAKQNPQLRKGTPWINEDMYSYCNYYFKRECYPEDKKQGIIPLLFGAVDKNFSEYELLEDKTIDIFCSFGQVNDGLRLEATQICQKLKNEGYNVVTESNLDYETFKKYILSSYISIILFTILLL